MLANTWKEGSRGGAGAPNPTSLCCSRVGRRSHCSEEEDVAGRTLVTGWGEGVLARDSVLLQVTKELPVLRQPGH